MDDDASGLVLGASERRLLLGGAAAVRLDAAGRICFGPLEVPHADAPTLADATRVLGRLPPLDEAATAALHLGFERVLGEPQGLGALAAAALVLDRAHALLAQAIHDVVEEAHAGEVVLVAEGQAPLHATAVARLAGIHRVVMPAHPAPDTAEEALEAAATGRRPVWMDRRLRDAALYDHARLPRDAILRGPAVVEDGGAALVIEPGDRAVTDAHARLVVDVRPLRRPSGG